MTAPDSDAGLGWAATRERVASLTGQIVLIAAIWSLVSIPLRHRAWDWPTAIDITFGVVNVPAEPSLFTAAVMVLLAGALRRRLRAALAVAAIFEAGVGVLQLAALGVGVGIGRLPVHNAHVAHYQLAYFGVSGVLGIGLAGLLWWCRRQFPARLRRGAAGLALLTLVGGLLTSIGITIALTFAFPHTLRGVPHRALWAARVALGAVTDVPGMHLHHQDGPHWLITLAGLLSALALLAAVSVFARSARSGQTLDAAQELRVRRLVIEGGERDSLGYFATRRDKQVVFSPDGRAAVSYRVVASVSLAAADPIGRVASWPAAVAAWLADARAHGWHPAVLSASSEGATAYTAAGLRALSLGDEAIIDVDSFRLDGPTMRPVRQAVARVRRAGYGVTVRRHGDIAPAEMAELTEACERWRGDAVERGFSMALNRLGDPTDERCVMVTAHDRDGRVRGLLSFVPWGSRGLSLDLMRRDRAAENGLIEYLVAGLVEKCPELAVSRISLNFAMFRAIFSAVEQVGAGPVTRWTAAALSVASRFWQIESLYRSNAKYLPVWVPRFLCYDSSLTLSRVAVAAGIAEGFLPGPRSMPARTGTEAVRVEDGRVVSLVEAVREQRERLARRPPRVPRVREQQRVRQGKVERLRAAGMPAYPVRVPRTCSIGEVRERFGCHPAAGGTVSVCGRVRALRDLGGVSFAVLHEDGATVQALLDAGRVPADALALWKRTVDIGDQVSVTGEIGASRSGELSVLADSWAMAGKCLHPLPSPRAGLTDPEARVRQRHVDLMVNPGARAALEAGRLTVAALRETLDAAGFAEVATPMLQPVHGGAAARPFRTHSNAYDVDLYLRIAPELYLKRLAVAGMSRIYELNRNFRNEGADTTHNPEFTSLEAYQAHADYGDMRVLTRRLILAAAERVHGGPVALRPTPDGRSLRVDIGGEWPVRTVHEAVSAACGQTITPHTDAAAVRAICARHDVPAATDARAGTLVVTLYEALVEKQTQFPTFYTDFPIENCPLTRAHRDDPSLAERWDLVAFGAEIATAYSELTDPVDQRARLTEQSLLAAAGDPEAMELDEAFLGALEYAMPPTGGLGMGVDRLVMLLTGTGIRATLAFPFVRPSAR